MNVRQFLVLFVSSMTLSLVILIVFFSLFFKNIDFHFDTRLPQSAPVLPESVLKHHDATPESFKADGIQHAQVHVPSESQAPQVGVGVNPLLPSSSSAPPPAPVPTVTEDDVTNTLPMDAPSQDETSVSDPDNVPMPKPAKPPRKSAVIPPPPPPPEPPIPAPPQ